MRGAATSPFSLKGGSEPGKTAALALAIVVHVAFFAFLYFGISWQRKPQEPLVAELWSELPPPRPQPPVNKVVPEPPLPPKPPALEERKPEPPPPPVVQPKPVVVQPKPEPKEPSKADIELKEKQRKLQEKREADEARRKEELARKEEEKKLKAEQRRQEEQRRREEQAQQEELRKQEEVRRKEEEKRLEATRRDDEKRMQDEARVRQAWETLGVAGPPPVVEWAYTWPDPYQATGAELILETMQSAGEAVTGAPLVIEGGTASDLYSIGLYSQGMPSVCLGPGRFGAPEAAHQPTA